jgi:hypothetical protein
MEERKARTNWSKKGRIKINKDSEEIREEERNREKRENK